MRGANRPGFLLLLFRAATLKHKTSYNVFYDLHIFFKLLVDYFIWWTKNAAHSEKWQSSDPRLQSCTRSEYHWTKLTREIASRLIWRISPVFVGFLTETVSQSYLVVRLAFQSCYPASSIDSVAHQAIRTYKLLRLKIRYSHVRFLTEKVSIDATYWALL